MLHAEPALQGLACTACGGKARERAYCTSSQEDEREGSGTVKDDKIVSFDEWVRYCFDKDSLAHTGNLKEDSRIECMKGSVVADYLARLFENPSFLAEQYTDDELAKGIWYIFGTKSSFLHVAREDDVPKPEQIRWVTAIRTLYAELLDRVCNDRGSRSLENKTDGKGLDGAVLMIWDMDCLSSVCTSPAHKHLVDPVFRVLESLLSCRTSTCIMSALHGLGHLVLHYSHRVNEFVNDFLNRRSSLPAWLREYAESARTGMIQ